MMLRSGMEVGRGRPAASLGLLAVAALSAACDFSVDVPLPEGAEETSRFFMYQPHTLGGCGPVSVPIFPVGKLPPLIGPEAERRRGLLLELPAEAFAAEFEDEQWI